MSEHYDAEEIAYAINAAYEQGRADAVMECITTLEDLYCHTEHSLDDAIAAIRKVGEK